MSCRIAGRQGLISRVVIDRNKAASGRDVSVFKLQPSLLIALKGRAITAQSFNPAASADVFVLYQKNGRP